MHIFYYFSTILATSLFGTTMNNVTLTGENANDFTLKFTLSSEISEINTTNVVFSQSLETKYSNNMLYLKKLLRFSLEYFLNRPVVVMRNENELRIENLYSTYEEMIKNGKNISSAHNLMDYDCFYIEFNVKIKQKHKIFRTPYYGFYEKDDSVINSMYLKETSLIHTQEADLKDTIYSQKNFEIKTKMDWNHLGRMCVTVSAVFLCIGIIIFLIRRHIEMTPQVKKNKEFEQKMKEIEKRRR